MADPYSRAHELEQQDRKHAQAAIELAAGGKPFNSMSHAKDCFDKTVYTGHDTLLLSHCSRSPTAHSLLSLLAIIAHSRSLTTLTVHSLLSLLAITAHSRYHCSPAAAAAAAWVVVVVLWCVVVVVLLLLLG